MDHVALIYKVLSQQATREEKAELECWILESEENRQEFEDIKLLWESSNAPDESHLADDSGFDWIKLRMKEHIKRKRRIRTLFSTLLLILITSLLVFLLSKTWFAPLEQIRFDRMEMSDVIKVLEERYKIEIEVTNPRILSCRYTAILLNVDDEHLVLTSIEHSLNVKFIDQGKNKYNLVGDVCSVND